MARRGVVGAWWAQWPNHLDPSPARAVAHGIPTLCALLGRAPAARVANFERSLMSTNYKSTMSKRQRELDQKDRVKEREARRVERKARAEHRAATGQVGPRIAEPLE